MAIQPTHQVLRPWPSQIIVVGCGGVGSYLIPGLLRTVRNHRSPPLSPEIILVDGDILEPKNMERQLFTDEDIGKNKAFAMYDHSKVYYGHKLICHDQFFTGGEEKVQMGALLIACVDNHPGRARILDCTDRVSGDAIICGNGYTDAEAMFYSSSTMQGSKMDPRIMFPEILTDHADDPLAAQIGCTGEAQAATPQLAIANLMAAAYALHLLWFHYQEIQSIDPEFRGHSPLRHASNASRITTKKIMEAV